MIHKKRAISGYIWKNRDDSPAGYMILTEEDGGTLKVERKYWIVF